MIFSDFSSFFRKNSQVGIRGLYHTHKKSNPPSIADKAWSDKYNLPIYTIGANGESYIYFGGEPSSPVNLEIID